MEDKKNKRNDGVIAGRNAVTEALRSGRVIDSIIVARGNLGGAVSSIIAKAKNKNIPIKEADTKKLDFMCGGAVHQGIVAVAAIKEYASVDDIFALAETRGELPFIIIADGLEDPHNLGAIIRTAECAGAHGVIIPRRHATGLTYAVGKASAGAIEYVPVARVTNIAATIEELKQRGLWIYAADMDGQPWCEADLKGAVGLVVGNEGKGVSRLVKEKCDVVLSLPMKGQINSLNASVAAGIMMYEISRQRSGLNAK